MTKQNLHANGSRDTLAVPKPTVRAPYSEKHEVSRGRLIAEPGSPTRSDFQRDRDRIIHSDAFRRLMHKTQVFVHNEGDHFRTRLTHSIEVGQISRALARALGCDEDLAEALALVHDFGHPPFGHAGERVLQERMKGHGGFDHNAQSLRIVTHLERRYAQFDGLNLTWETLEGLVKHNGPLTDADGDGLDGPVPEAISNYNRINDLQLHSWPSVEAQCAAIADDIAYDNHDLDDAFRAGLIELEDIGNVGWSATILETIRGRYPGIDDDRLQHELVRFQITAMVEDVIAESLGRLKEAGCNDPADVRDLGYAVVGFSTALASHEKELKTFLFQNMYRAEAVMRPVRDAQRILEDLFDAFASGRAPMPSGTDWSLDGLGEGDRMRQIADYLAGMTDRYAISEHRRLFDHTPELR